MSRYESIVIPMGQAVLVTDVDTVVIAWRDFKSRDLPPWDAVCFIVVNLDTSNQVTVALSSSGRPPASDEVYEQVIPPGEQRSFRATDMPRHHCFLLIARADAGKTASLVYEVVVRQNI